MSARVREVLLLAGRQNSSALPRAQGGGWKGCLRFPAGHCDSVLRCAPRTPTQVAGRGPPQSGIRRAGRHPLPLTPSSWWRPRGLPPLRGQEPRPRREARQALVDRSSSRLSASPGGGRREYRRIHSRVVQRAAGRARGTTPISRPSEPAVLALAQSTAAYQVARALRNARRILAWT